VWYGQAPSGVRGAAVFVDVVDDDKDDIGVEGGNSTVEGGGGAMAADGTCGINGGGWRRTAKDGSGRRGTVADGGGRRRKEAIRRWRAGDAMRLRELRYFCYIMLQVVEGVKYEMLLYNELSQGD
jgi:hypothetical protein